MNQSEIWIVNGARTPIGSFQGTLSGFSAPELGAKAIAGALERSGVDPSWIDEVIMGNVLSAGVGQAPARQAALGAGLSDAVPAVTVNKVCGSGMKALIMGAQSIRVGESKTVVAGGMESMSRAPYLLTGARAGYRMGSAPMIDSMIHDGLWDPYHDQHMGNCGDLCANEKRFSREEQDAFAIESFKRAQLAQSSGVLSKEIAAFEVQDKKGNITRIEHDEGPGKARFDKIPTLKPAFSKDGSVTAANASSINDGAAALILMDSEVARAKKLQPLARLVSYAGHAQKPEWFTTAPAPAMKKAMERAGWSVDEVDLFEVNEAFAVVTLAAMRELEIPHEKMNVLGGAIALGHPIGASGARIVLTLLNALATRGLKRGVAGICIGGGEALAVCVERI